MRKPVYTPFLVVLSLLAGGMSSVHAASPIEAVKGKEYTITKDHGPWMIMVASFSRVRDEANQKKDGFSAREAAAELVYELRKKKIPAYIVMQDAKKGEIETSNRLLQREKRVYAAQRDMICVLAGNYNSIDEETREGKSAHVTLNYIKNHFKADFLLENGARFKPTPGQPTPLSGAFFTVNPLLSPEEVKDATADPLLVKYNTMHDYSLFENPHQYTVVIATFTNGNTKIMLGDDEEREKSILDKLKLNKDLDKAAADAWKLAEAMRNASEIGYGEDYEVYVWHDRRRSVVTIGGFDTMDDPRIAQYMQRYAAKQKPLPKDPSQSVIVAEFFTVPKTKDFTQAKQHWLFDPMPRVMKVPKASRGAMAN